MLGHIGILYICILIATKCITLGGGGDVPIRVNGLINQSVLLSVSVDPSHPVQQVYWNFQTHIMATFTNNQLTVIRSQFKGRLEILDNGRAMRIGQLTMNDSGIYAVTVTFTDNTIHDESYNLTVYEPVPTPSIRTEEMKNTSDWCNVTLRCPVPTNTSSLSYTWKYRHGDSDYQLYNNPGDTIQISLQPESWDTEVLCIVHNPADQKNVSLDKFCPDYSPQIITGKQNRGYYAFWLLPVVPSVGLGWYIHKKKKKLRKESQSHVTEEISYAELRLGQSNVPKQVPKNDWNPPVEQSEDILYSTLRHNTG